MYFIFCATISRSKILYSQRDKHPFKHTVIENDHCGLFFCLQTDITHVGYSKHKGVIKILINMQM